MDEDAPPPPLDAPVGAGAPTEDGRPRINRRRFLGWTAVGGAATAAAAFGIVEASDGSRPQAHQAVGTGRGHRPPSTAHPTPAPPATKVRLVTTPDGVTLPSSAAVVAENAKPGDLWWLTTPQNAGDIEGFASQVSAVVGETIDLYVSTKAASFRVDAFRMGYYNGIGGRRIWSSAPVTGARQPPPVLIPPTNTIECQWTPSLSVTIDATWPPGAYLLKLVGTTGEEQFIPLCVRDDTSHAALVIQHSVTTWQAYNRWGGYSLYYGNAGGALSFTHAPADGTYADRSRIVSFDRPYDHDWAAGAADFVGNELPVIYQAEQLGLDVTYWTDIDLHAQPQLLDNHKALISLGHDEYWSSPMRDGAAQSLAAGVNFAFLGANACYRQIRFEPSAIGPNRLQVCYKSAAEDPMTALDATLVTVNWPQAPVSRPEAQLIGSTYQDIAANADMVVTDPSSWAFAGTGLTANQHLATLIQGEFDRYVPGAGGPDNLDVLAHSVVSNRNNNYSDVTWYTVPGGGGVFATGNASWVSALADSAVIPPNLIPHDNPALTGACLRIMQNVYAAIALGPASLTQPSQGSWRFAYNPGVPAPGAPAGTTTA